MHRIVASCRLLRGKGWLLRAVRDALMICLIVATPALAQDDAQEATADQCIAHHVQGQALRAEGLFTAAAEQLKACLHTSCSPLLRTDCAAILRSVEVEVPTVVLSARSGGTDLVEVRVHAGARLIATRLDGRPIALDAGVQVLTFEAPGVPTLTHSLVVRAGEKNRLVSVVLGPVPDAKPARAPAEERAQAGASGHHVTGSPTASQSARSGAEVNAPAPVLLAWDYALFGAGLGLAGAGAGVGLSALADQRHGEDTCEPECRDSLPRRIERKGRIADSLFALSAATLVVATIRLVVRKPWANTAHVVLGPTSIAGRVSF